jgi:hypothetical protein
MFARSATPRRRAQIFAGGTTFRRGMISGAALTSPGAATFAAVSTFALESTFAIASASGDARSRLRRTDVR